MEKELQKAQKFLSELDPYFANLIEVYGNCKIVRKHEEFRELVDAIISQQLSVKAGSTICNRFFNLYASVNHTDNLAPNLVLNISTDEMRAVGISNQKAKYIHNLANHFIENSHVVTNFDAMSNSEIIDNLTKVKGIGRWTTEMFLMFSLGRLDVFPFDDLGIKNAIKKKYNLEEKPSKEFMIEVSEQWAPYRTVASWYLWRSLNNS